MCQGIDSIDHVLSGTRARKRKQAEASAFEPYAKRHPNCTAPIARSTSPLLGILRQYGLLEAIISNINADDLLALALTSKGLHEAISPRPGSLENLLGRLECSGKGIAIRNASHKKSTYFYSFKCTEYVQCGSARTRGTVETRPCVACKVATCDECRAHVVYQSTYEESSDPDDLAELPNFSGFVLLHPFEHPILSPHHLPSDATRASPRWQNPSTGKHGPYHDQGFLDVPLQMDAAAPPECIEELLDLDLGQQSLTSISADSRWESPSPVFLSLCEIVDGRKVFLCETCFERDAPKGPQTMRPSNKPMPPPPWLTRPTGVSPITACHCTLRNRFLDRWLCLPCYQVETTKLDECTGTMPMEWTHLCRCNANACHTLCLWCWGEVTELTDDPFDAERDDNGSSPW
jgi:hypothetical protein